VCAKSPGSFWDLELRSSGSADGGDRRIPVSPPAGLAGEEVRRGLGAHSGLMVAGVGVGQRRRGVHGRAEARRPPQS
jgi:hypothetical protein